MKTTVLLFLLVCLSEASLFNLELQFHNYSNPNTLNINGNCCDGRFGGNCISPCEPFFTVCLKDLNSSNNCPWSNQTKVSGISSGDILSFSSTIGGNLSNPIEFYNVNSTNAIQIYIYIQDSDFGFLPVVGIDEIFVQVPLSSNTTSPVQQYTGMHGSATMALSYQVTCSDNYYGADCSVFCEPQNNTDGHYTCNSATGAIECLPGYTNVTSNCVHVINSNMPSTHTTDSNMPSTHTTDSSMPSTHTTDNSMPSLISTYTTDNSVTSTHSSTTVTSTYITNNSITNIKSTVVTRIVPSTTSPIPNEGGADGAIIGAVIAILVLLVIGILLTVIIIFIVLRKRKHKMTSSLPGSTYYSSVKDPKLVGPKSLDNPLYGGEQVEDLKLHMYECCNDLNLSTSGTYEVMDQGKAQYGVLYETPHNAAQYTEGIEMSFSKEEYVAPMIHEEPVGPRSTVSSYVLNNSIYGKGASNNLRVSDYEEPVASKSSVEENLYTSMNYSESTAEEHTKERDSGIYEVPVNADSNYEEPWKRTF